MPVSRGAKSASSSKPNPFDSDSDSEDFTSNAAKKSSTTYKAPADAKKRYKDGFRDSGGLENQSVQELENYAAYKAEETTDALSGCLRIAEDIKQDASNTLITLHKQGEQISRTHEKAVEIDQDLTKVLYVHMAVSRVVEAS
jgi:synaptosomal-associated protein 25